MRAMAYGTRLRSKSTYRRIYRTIKDEINRVGVGNFSIEHVGGTSLNTPSGKGDIDIYLSYRSKKEQNKLKAVLNIIFGKPAKVTPTRIRYNAFIDGIEVELQLIDKKSSDTAVALRDYLNAHPIEAKRYAQEVARMRKVFLTEMFEFKQTFALQAISRKK